MAQYATKPLLSFVALFAFTHLLQASENTIEGYWFSSGSIIEIKVCEQLICAEILALITEEEIDPLTVLDDNNTDRDLRERTLVGINLFDGFQKELLLNETLKGGRIYDPRRGRFYNAELTLLENDNLLVEGCLLFICDGEEWLPLEVTINPDGSRQATLKSNSDQQ